MDDYDWGYDDKVNWTMADGNRIYFLTVVESVDEAKFTARQIAREQYQAASSLARYGGWEEMPQSLIAHFTEVKNWRSFKYLPDNLQYQAVSQRYQEYMEERIKQHNGYENVISDLMRDYYYDQWASISRIW